MTSHVQSKLVEAIDELIVKAEMSKDFTDEELTKVKTVKDMYLNDMALIEEARGVLQENRERLERKEQSLSEFMTKLTPEDLESPLIKKLLEYFITTHIALDDRIQKVEEVLHSMYPGWNDLPVDGVKNDLSLTNSDEDHPPNLLDGEMNLFDGDSE